MNKTVLGVIVVVAVIGGGIYIFSNKRQYSTPAPEQVSVINNNQKAQQGTSTTLAVSQTFSAADVAKHNLETSCYTIIRGNVYDVTAFIPKHPGGTDPILTGCGTDGTEAFVDKHGGNEKMETILETMKIGVLATQ
ncbi:MAG: cytochrome b5-like heme/steroid binding domain-containing protein [Candidatus Paceibacterota bacterium]|jgi:cytochrome b involved in lipid metabolism